jgi:hypothetical protein
MPLGLSRQCLLHALAIEAVEVQHRTFEISRCKGATLVMARIQSSCHGGENLFILSHVLVEQLDRVIDIILTRTRSAVSGCTQMKDE